MPDTEDVRTRFTADTTDLEAGSKRASDSINLVGKSGGNLFRNLLILRGALGAAESMMKKFGLTSEQTSAAMEGVNFVLSAGIGILAIYRAGLIITKAIHWLTARAAAAQAAAQGATLLPFVGAGIAITAILAAWAAAQGFAPRAQFGGMFPARPGGTLVRLAEAGRAEWVVPESRMGRGGGGVNVTMNVQTNDPDELVRVLGRRIQQLRTAGY